MFSAKSPTKYQPGGSQSTKYHKTSFWRSSLGCFTANFYFSRQRMHDRYIYIVAVQKRRDSIFFREESYEVYALGGPQIVHFNLINKDAQNFKKCPRAL